MSCNQAIHEQRISRLFVKCKNTVTNIFQISAIVEHNLLPKNKNKIKNETLFLFIINYSIQIKS